MNAPRCRVLLVDDHDPIRDALRALISACDELHIVGEARDGEEAIIQATSCHPDIILMDIDMPRMDGIQATTVIKKSRREMAIIGLCLVHDTYTVEAFLKAGGLAVVSKDRLTDLRSTLQRACIARQRQLGNDRPDSIGETEK